MKLLSFVPFKQSKNPKQIISQSWKSREKILASDVNLFCWKRPVINPISNYLLQLLEKELPPIQFNTSVHEIEQNINIVRLNWDQNLIDQGNLFWNDICQLTKDFLLLSKMTSGTVHLKVINNNACSKFHTDQYKLRLFTTYLGEGTQWLPEKATNRKGLGKTNELILRDKSKIQQLAPFEVGILKGTIPGLINQNLGIVHRSPEIEEKKGRRVILRVDI